MDNQTNIVAIISVVTASITAITPYVSNIIMKKLETKAFHQKRKYDLLENFSKCVVNYQKQEDHTDFYEAYNIMFLYSDEWAHDCLRRIENFCKSGDADQAYLFTQMLLDGINIESGDIRLKARYRIRKPRTQKANKSKRK